MSHREGVALGEREVRAAFSGDRAALQALLRELTPIVRVRVARTLYRHRGWSRRRDLAQETDDLAQEVFVELFQDGGRVLRSWDPQRGLSLIGFVRMVADRTAGSILRSGVRTPWRDEPIDPHEFASTPAAQSEVEAVLMSRELAGRVYEALLVELTPLALRAFQVLFVEEADVATACTELGMKTEAVYAWRSRLIKTIRRLAQELEAESEAARPTGTVGASRGEDP